MTVIEQFLVSQDMDRLWALEKENKALREKLSSLESEMAECRKWNKAPTVPVCQECGTILNTTEKDFCHTCKTRHHQYLASREHVKIQ